MDQAFALRQVEISSQALTKSLESASEALELLKTAAASHPPITVEFLDDLATAATLTALIGKEIDDSKNFQVDVSSQRRVEKQAAEGDPDNDAFDAARDQNNFFRVSSIKI